MLGISASNSFRTIPLPFEACTVTIPNTCTKLFPVGLVEVYPPSAPKKISVPAGNADVSGPIISPEIIPLPS